MMVQPQKTEAQVLEETVLQLHAENQAMEKQLKNLEKEMEYYRGDVRTKVTELNEAQSHWLTLLSIVIGAIVLVLGVGVPLALNSKSEKYIEKMLSDAKQEAASAKRVVLFTLYVPCSALFRSVSISQPAARQTLARRAATACLLALPLWLLMASKDELL